MAQQELLICSVCLDGLKDPVTIPCGHSYCMSCIRNYWDINKERKTNSCPQCRQSFKTRPALVKNTILAELVEDFKKQPFKVTFPALSGAAGPGDVPCDFCTGIKLKALKSCLWCTASFCEQHLQPHLTVPLMRKHKLTEATLSFQDNICSHHDEVRRIFCRTDQQCICYLCLMDDHKGHDTVPAETERAKRQKELEASQQKIHQRIQDKEKNVTVLRERAQAFNVSADQAVEKSNEIFAEVQRFMEQRRSKVKQLIRAQQETEVSRNNETEEKLQREIIELRQKKAEMETLLGIEDLHTFLMEYNSMSCLSESKEDLRSMVTHPLGSFKDVAVAVSEARDKLIAVLNEVWAKILMKVSEVEDLPPQGEPTTRAGFQKYSCLITLDPNTAQKRLSLLANNRRVVLLAGGKANPSNPERFAEKWQQVLSEDGLTGRCYWEVKCSGIVYVAVAYKTISRVGTREECEFGCNDKSWALVYKRGYCEFTHNATSTVIEAPTMSSTIGVYLDHRAGTLCFYSVFESMNLLYRVQTTFTEPLYAGLGLPDTAGSWAELCKLK